ncbi:MAG TPA: hypothetical protein VGR00_03190 [Thermoanaerobaculia bacterium]|nr:hypothetical protein [Thermoanaerobaculia bacterium]
METSFVSVSSTGSLETPFIHLLPDGRAVCSVCPRRCRLERNGTGTCGALRFADGDLHRTHKGCAFDVRVTAAEGCGLTRFHPGTAWLGIESPGSGLQVQHDLVAGGPDQLLSALSAEEAVFLARVWGCKGIYLDTDDPVFGVGEGFEILQKARAASLKTAVVSTGYLLPRSRELLFANADAVSLTLFSIAPGFYRRRFGARPDPVLETVQWLRRRPSIWVEVTLPLFVGENDKPVDVDHLARWVDETLGPSTPFHVVSADPFLPPGALERAAETARRAGLVDVGVPTPMHLTLETPS